MEKSLENQDVQPFRETGLSWVVVAHTFNPGSQEVEAEAGRSLKLEVSLIYRGSSRTTRATQRNPVSKQNIT